MPLPQRPIVRRKSRVGMAIGIALLVHALLLPFVAREIVFHVPANLKRQAVSLVATPRSQVQHTQLGQRSNTPSAGFSKPPDAPELPKELKLEPVTPPNVQGQVVSLGKPLDERAPDKPTKYLSEHDSRVEKETRARETSAMFKNALSKVQREGKNEKAKQAAKPQEAAGENGQGGGSAPKVAEKSELPARERRDALHLDRAADGTVRNRPPSDAVGGTGKRVATADPQPAQNTDPAPGTPGLQPGAPGRRNPLKLTLDNPMEAAGPVAGGPMPDDLRGVDEGDETLLNSRAFKYAGFINRVKEAVGRVWTQRVQDETMKHDPTGQLFAFRDRRTIVEYTLDKNGEILDVHVTNSSGVPYLDDVAVESFRIVQRFPNPPPGLIDPAGNVHLQFGFTLLAAERGIRLQTGPAYLPNSPAARGF